MSNRPTPSIPVLLFRFFSGYGLAVVCLLLLLILTWLSTLEQPAKGLYEVQKRYYDAEAWYVIPDLPWLYVPDKSWIHSSMTGKQIIISLPGAYLVSAVLFINLLCGGLIRIRKGWKYAGVITAHFSMIALLFAGFVSHHYSKEGIMFVLKDQESDFARSYTEYTIEVFEMKDGEVTKPFVVPGVHLNDLDPDDKLEVEFPDLPFDIEVTNWFENCQLVTAKADDDEGIDGFKLVQFDPEKTQEENSAGCHVSILPKKGEASPAKILIGGGVGQVDSRPNVFFPNSEVFTASVDGKVYGFRMVREIWPMPFKVHLDDSIGEYYPGTMKPSFFQSKITRIADDGQKKFTIRMNEPMRYGGYTLYQARWSGKTEVPQSGFAIVTNPSDKWPEYCTYIASFGLLFHFGMKLFGFIGRNEKKSLKEQTS